MVPPESKKRKPAASEDNRGGRRPGAGRKSNSEMLHTTYGNQKGQSVLPWAKAPPQQPKPRAVSKEEARQLAEAEKLQEVRLQANAERQQHTQQQRAQAIVESRVREQAVLDTTNARRLAQLGAEVGAELRGSTGPDDSLERRKCANAQFGCKEFADVCQGYRPELCKGYLDGRVVLRGTKEDQEKLRREAKNTKKRARAAKARRQKKLEHQQAMDADDRLLMSRTLNIYNCMCSHIRT
jgi:hypothetical protein